MSAWNHVCGCKVENYNVLNKETTIVLGSEFIFIHFVNLAADNMQLFVQSNE